MMFWKLAISHIISLVKIMYSYRIYDIIFPSYRNEDIEYTKSNESQECSEFFLAPNMSTNKDTVMICMQQSIPFH